MLYYNCPEGVGTLPEGGVTSKGGNTNQHFYNFISDALSRICEMNSSVLKKYGSVDVTSVTAWVGGENLHASFRTATWLEGKYSQGYHGKHVLTEKGTKG